MTVFVQFAHHKDGYIYIDPRDILGFRTRLQFDETASSDQPLVVILRNGTCEAIHAVSIKQIVYLRGLMAKQKEDAIIPFEKLLEAHE